MTALQTKDLLFEQAGLVKENRSVLELAIEEKRELTAEETSTIEAREERIGKIDSTIEMIQRHNDAEENAEERAQAVGQPSSRGAPSRDDAENRELAMEAFNDLVVARTLGTQPQLDETRRQAYIASIANPQKRTALQADDFSGGGSLVVPMQFINELLKEIDDMTVMRGLSRQITLNAAESLGVPTIETKVDDAAWQGEGQSITRDTSLVTGRRELTPYLSVKLVRVSRKLVRISATPVDGMLRGEFARLFGETEENAFQTGGGAQRPLGVFTASAQGISTSRDYSTGNSTTGIVADNLVGNLYNLKEGYANRATWIFHRDAIRDIRQLKDGNGQYLWQAGIAGDRPGTILDRPYRMSEFAPNTFTTGQYVGIIGDFSYYWIVTSLDMEIQVLSELYAATNEFGYIGRMEVDGMPTFENPFSRVTLA